MAKLERFNPDQERQFEAILHRWSNLVCSTDPIDPQAAGEAVEAIYRNLKQPEPLIVPCRSPLQLALVPDLFRQIQRGQTDKFSERLAEAAKLLQTKAQVVPAESLSLLVNEILEQGNAWGWQGFEDLHSKISVGQRGFLSNDRFFDLSRIAERQIDDHLDELLQRRLLGPLQAQRWRLADFAWTQLNQDARPAAADARRESNAERLRRVRELVQRGQQVNPESMTSALFPMILQPESPILWTAAREILFGWRQARSAALIEFCSSILNSQFDSDVQDWLRLGKAVHGFMRFDKVCFVSDRPTKLSLDERDRPHSLAGPAIEYSDGYAIYAFHGVAVDARKKHIIDEPEKITLTDIDAEVNVELRRVMIDRFGIARYVQESGAQVVDRDYDPTTGHERVLYRRELLLDEPIVLLQVTNTTPEPDGSYKQYFIRVPPNMGSAQQAVAWTFGMSADEYRPTRQT